MDNPLNETECLYIVEGCRRMTLVQKRGCVRDRIDLGRCYFAAMLLLLYC